jgi:regulator of sirC expression with transglutaminase-like and TPR domain
MQPADCENLVRQVTGMTFQATPESLRPVPVGLVVQRMLMNLKGIYLRTGDYDRAVRVIERLRQLTPDDPLQQRDLGASLLQAGRHGRAINHLSAYLSACPKAEDAKSVRSLLEQARGEIARWN